MSTPSSEQAPASVRGQRKGWRHLVPLAGVPLLPQVAGLGNRVIEGARETARRVAEAARDARYRLRTGRPRGVPVNFVHPPLECSKACSQAARRVHGLLYGYSLAYEEVRPRAETVAQALGYSKSTTYNAIGELRRAGLLVVHERRGRDDRRIANRYDVLSDAVSAIPEFRREGSEAERRRSEPQKTRIDNTKSPISNARSTIETTNSTRHSAPTRPRLPHRTGRRAGGGSLCEQDLDQAIGESLFRGLRDAFGDDLGELRHVIEQEQALKHPPLLRAACEAMLKKPGALDNPGGYLRSILRRQQRELEGMQEELLELEEAHRQACMYEDPDRADLESRIDRLKAAVEGHEPDAETRGTNAMPIRRSSLATPAVPTPRRHQRPDPDKPTSAAEPRDKPSASESEGDGLEQTVLRLKRSNLAAARIVALHLPREVAERLLAPEPQGSSHTQPPSVKTA